jgi:hypothetical protein
LLMKGQFDIAHTICKTDSHITRQLGYKHIFCQKLCGQKIACHYFCKNMTCWSVYWGSVKSLQSSVKLCVTTNHWFISNFQRANYIETALNLVYKVMDDELKHVKWLTVNQNINNN